MNNVSIIHTADLHIGAQCSYLLNDAAVRRREILKTFENIIELAQENNTQLILIAGDLFDSNKVEDFLINGVFAALNSLENTKVVIALGNHDPYTADSPFLSHKLNDNIYILGKEDTVLTFDSLKCRVYGASFDGVYNEGSHRFSLTPPNDDYINLMVIHGEARADMGGNYRPITPEFVKYSGMDYIALGHVHTKSEVQYMGTTAIAYCGCPEGQGFDESGEKGIYMGKVSKENADLKFIPTAKRTHYCLNVDVTDVTNIRDKIKEEIEKSSKSFKDNYYKIVLTGKREEKRKIDIPSLIADLSMEVSFIKIKDKTEIDIDYEVLSKEKNLKGYFAMLMLEKINTSSGDEKQKYIDALRLGIESFNGEVNFDED